MPFVTMFVNHEKNEKNLNKCSEYCEVINVTHNVAICYSIFVIYLESVPVPNIWSCQRLCPYV